MCNIAEILDSADNIWVFGRDVMVKVQYTFGLLEMVVVSVIIVIAMDIWRVLIQFQ